VKVIQCNIPNSLYRALSARMTTDQARNDHVIADALSRYLGKRSKRQTLFSRRKSC
jgi:hypothetical protein